jgi:hypothetical protein
MRVDAWATCSGGPSTASAAAKAADILGMANESSVYRLAATGGLTKPKHARHAFDRDQVEQVALQRYRRGHRYWASTSGAAAILGVTTNRVRQLGQRGVLPAVNRDGRHYFRRHRVEVIANARDARKVSEISR